jgi:hypothetical protein
MPLRYITTRWRSNISYLLAVAYQVTSALWRLADGRLDCYKTLTLHGSLLPKLSPVQTLSTETYHL